MDEAFERFNRSLSLDRRLILEDIEGSMAYAEALERAGVLSPQELRQILGGLGEIRNRTQQDPDFLADAKDEDVHSFVGSTPGGDHWKGGAETAHRRSRNDQVAVDTRLFLKKAIGQVQQGLKALMGELLNQARRHPDVVVPGYTHLRKAQPILLAHYLLAFFEDVFPDRDRFQDCFRRTDCMPLGAGALAGNAFAIDREALRKTLGFFPHHGQQPGRRQRPGLSGGLCQRQLAHPGAPQPTGRRSDFLLDARVRLDRAFGPSHHR